MKRIGPLLVASSLSWQVALLPQPIQAWAALQSDAPQSGGAQRDRQERHRVDCDRAPTGALQKAIAATDPGDTLVVSGTCHEHVTVPVDKNSISLDGRGTAAIIRLGSSAADRTRYEGETSRSKGSRLQAAWQESPCGTVDRDA